MKCNTLSDKEVSVLDKCIDKYQAADSSTQMKIGQEFFNSFSKTMPLEARESPQAYIAHMNSVHAQIATLGLFSHISSLFASTFVAKCDQWGVNLL